jgi:hypothetical protein
MINICISTQVTQVRTLAILYVLCSNVTLEQAAMMKGNADAGIIPKPI